MFKEVRDGRVVCHAKDVDEEMVENRVGLEGAGPVAGSGSGVVEIFGRHTWRGHGALGNRIHA